MIGWLMLLLLAACSGPVETGRTVRDLMGRDVFVPEEPTRFVCIGPGALRLYSYVAPAEQLVGIEAIERAAEGRAYVLANHELFDQLPIIGPGGPAQAPDPEQLMAVAPEVIFTTYGADAKALDSLQQKTGIPVVGLSYGDHGVYNASIERSIRLIGQVSHQSERAEQVAERIKAWLAELSSRTKDIADKDKPKVYIGAQSHQGSHGIESTTGQESVLMTLHAQNVVDESGIDRPVQWDREALLLSDPDIIFLDGGGLGNVLSDLSRHRAFYQSLRAVADGQTHLLLSTNHYAKNIDVSLANAFYIGHVLYPEQFSGRDPAAVCDEICHFLVGKPLYREIADYSYGGYQSFHLLDPVEE